MNEDNRDVPVEHAIVRRIIKLETLIRYSFY